MTDRDDEFEAHDDDLAERLADVDEDLAEQRAAALRGGLDDYELDEEDIELLEHAEEGEDGITYLPALPVIAIVGRPNVGKSALVNRILGRREAVVEDTPGVTRDRVSYKGEWLDRRFTLVDTGGWEPDAKGIDASVAAQAEVAIDLSDIVMFVVDATVGATSTDEHVVRLLRKAKKPVFLVANKVDDARQEPEAAALWNLGLGEPYPPLGPPRSRRRRPPRRGLQGAARGVGRRQAGDRRPSPRRDPRPPERRQELATQQGRRRRARRRERDRRHDARPPVDEQIELGGRVWRFVDTAGIRRRVHLQQAPTSTRRFAPRLRSRRPRSPSSSST